MAKYKSYSYEQSKLIPVYFDDQLLPGTFEAALNHIVDKELDLSIFLDRYKNDLAGAPAFDPAILLKIVFFAYSHGITSSRKIAWCCRNNILFKALSADCVPHFTTIADFISTMDKEITPLFRNVLLICDEMGLIGKEMFAIDGCKLPSNASKEWSGTRADFEKKVQKIEKTVAHILKRHREEDKAISPDASVEKKREKQLEKLRKKSEKIKKWLSGHEEKIGKTGKPLKQNMTDPDSAKMATSQGVIQGYNGIAAAEARHQVIVGAKAEGSGSEQDQLLSMIGQTEENLKAVGRKAPLSQETKVLADSGFHSEANMEKLEEKQIDGYIADKHYRQRDPRFETSERYKSPAQKAKYFKPADFKMDEKLGRPICPAGKTLYIKNRNFAVKGKAGITYRAKQSDCGPCSLRAKCLRVKTTRARQVTFFTGKTKAGKTTHTQKMIQKMDTEKGREIYSLRMGLIEPVFANIRSTKGLNRFSLRGKTKVNTQWLLFCITHNLGKIQKYGRIPRYRLKAA